MAFAYTNQKTKIKPIQKSYLKLGIGILAFFVLLAPTVQARTFNPHNIITDQELLNKNSLSQTAIQKFLERENSVLARFSQIVNDEALKASAMIWQISQKHNINPKFLLTTLEKEQALISRSQATEKALDWATGYGCYGGGCNEKYRGFYNQVEASAETQEIYNQKAGQFNFKVGVTTHTFDGYPVTPQNQATTNLYIYTPYVGNSPELGINNNYGGNRLFWRIWHRYFSSQKFLDGQVVTFNGEYYLISQNAKRKFISRELFLKDYSETDAVTVSSSDLAAYPDGQPINFANNTVVKAAETGQIFLIEENQRRLVTDSSALALLSDFRLAITESEIPAVSEAQLTTYTFGPTVTTSSIYPQGKLFRDESGQIWQVKDGLKHAVDNVVWQNRFSAQTPELTTTNQLSQYPTGSPIKLKDGTFILANAGYYLISNGERMKIQDEGIFNRVFGLSKKNNALSVSTALLEIHQASEMIDYIDDTIQDSTPTTITTGASGSYTASFDSMTPDGLILVNGQTQSVTTNFKNNGNAVWENNNVWLEISDQGKTSSSFGVNEKINFSQPTVSTGQLASFTFNLTAPTDQSGLLTQEFNLYYDKSGTKTKIISVGKFIIVKAGLSAQVLEHNLPIAVRNTWRPLEITMKIQNTSSDTTWLARKTALEIYNLDGSTSYFYDPNDWVRQEVAAVAINKTYIKPGEIGEFKFTIDPRNIKKGTHYLNIQLKLLDQGGKQVYLDGRLEWHREIRVD